MQLLFLISVAFVVSFSIAEGLDYGPSISSLTGVFVNYRNGPDLLSIQNKRSVKLEYYPGYSATLPLITGSSSATSEQIFKERGISTSGEFIVEAPKGFGIIAVIQQLKLRRTIKDRGRENATRICNDFVQFGDVKPDGSWQEGISPKVCGSVMKSDMSLLPKKLMGPRTYRSSGNRLIIFFNHAYVSELVESLLGSTHKPVLKAELTFTAYTTRNCSSNQPENSTFAMCNGYNSNSTSVCINDQLLCDGILNCDTGSTGTLGSDDDFQTCPDKPTPATEPKEEDDEDFQPDLLSNLQTYLGISSLAPYSRKYERKFRPSYIPSGSSSSGFLSDYSTKRSVVERIPSTTESSPAGGGTIEISVVGPSREVHHVSGHIDSPEGESGVYDRRELAHAINSVIYGVAVFIIFTIFITVFVVCITKKVQSIWTSREISRNDRSRVTRGSIPTQILQPPPPIPHVYAITVPSRSAECDPGIFDNAVSCEMDEELPPPYEMLFPETS